MNIETYMRAYFILNGVKVSESKKDKPIPPIGFMELQIDREDWVYKLWTSDMGNNYFLPSWPSIGITKEQAGEPESQESRTKRELKNYESIIRKAWKKT